MRNIKKKEYIGIFLISFSALLFEISLIRILSLMYSYHFALLVVSISLFGIAVGSSIIYVKRKLFSIYLNSLFYSISIILSYFVCSKIMFSPLRASYNYLYSYPLLIYYLFFALPFFFFGIIISTYFKNFNKESNKLYFYNLSGSAIGSVFALISISYLGQYSITFSALIGLIACLLFSKKRKEKIIVCLLILFLLIIPLRINFAAEKEMSIALNIPNSTHLNSKWNSYSRIDVINSSFTKYAPGLSLTFNENLPPQLGILTDGGDMTAITKKNNYSYTNYLPTSIGYRLIKNPRVLLINPRGGPDIVAGIKNNASMDILEYNSLIPKTLKKIEYFSGDIYNNSNLMKKHGRKFIKENKNYDLVIISLSGNVQSSGLYGLSQDYDLTYEGLKEYYNSLNKNGYLIITRWLSYPPKESLRLYSLAKKITKEEEIILFRTWSTVTLVMGKNPNYEMILNFTEKNKFDIIHMKYNFTPNKNIKFEEPIFYNTIKEINQNKNFYKEYLFDVFIVTDDRPFYFNFFKINKIKELKKIMGKNWQPFNDPGFLLLLLFIQAFVLCIVFIFLPLYTKHKKPNFKILFFLFIGLAYMLIEINFIQSFVMLFGNVTHSAAFIIFIMLTSSSFGSYYSNKFKIKNVFLLIISLTLFLYLFLGNIISYIINLNNYLAILISILIVAPISFFMGMPFPKAIKKSKKENVAWAFAVNGSASVLSSIAAIIIAIFFGFSIVLLLGLIFYLIAIFFYN